MNNQLIEKVIKSNDSNLCSEFSYENPLLDRNVAKALAKSFVKILRISRDDSNININLRHSVLANIRKMCKVEPEDHVEVDENVTCLLSKAYMNKLKVSQENDVEHSVNRSLDAFLIRKLKELDVNSNYHSSLNPEIIQALLNLNEKESNFALLTKDILHWDWTNKKTLATGKDLWTNTSLSNSSICNDISLKMKSEIEDILLNICHSILTDPNAQIKELFSSNSSIQNLINKSSISAECFQIICGVFNHLFMYSNYNTDIQVLISIFIQHVKDKCTDSISVLYPANLSNIVVLLDFDVDVLPEQLKSKYIAQTLYHLKKIHKVSESNLIMLLSHYPHFFDIYFNLSST